MFGSWIFLHCEIVHLCNKSSKPWDSSSVCQGAGSKKSRSSADWSRRPAWSYAISLLHRGLPSDCKSWLLHAHLLRSLSGDGKIESTGRLLSICLSWRVAFSYRPNRDKIVSLPFAEMAEVELLVSLVVVVESEFNWDFLSDTEGSDG